MHADTAEVNISPDGKAGKVKGRNSKPTLTNNGIQPTYRRNRSEMDNLEKATNGETLRNQTNRANQEGGETSWGRVPISNTKCRLAQRRGQNDWEASHPCPMQDSTSAIRILRGNADTPFGHRPGLAASCPDLQPSNQNVEESGAWICGKFARHSKDLCGESDFGDGFTPLLRARPLPESGSMPSPAKEIPATWCFKNVQTLKALK